MIYLNRQEQRIVIILAIILLFSIGILIVKRFQPNWIMQLTMGEPDFEVEKDQAPLQFKSNYPINNSVQTPKKQQVDQKSLSDQSILNKQANDTIKEEKTENKINRSNEIININTANIEELQKLPGIGPVKAKSIVDYRNQNGKFLTVDDILKVKGIGEKTLQKMRSLITVGN